MDRKTAASQLRRVASWLEIAEPLPSDEISLNMQASAWQAVLKQLKANNPTFMIAPMSGTECAIAEIRRLQEVENRARAFYEAL